MSYKRSFWTGAIGGMAGPVVGMLVGTIGAESLHLGTRFGWVSTVTGLGLGVLIPQIIEFSRTGDSKAYGRVALGSLAGVGIDIVLVLVLFGIGELL